MLTKMVMSIILFISLSLFTSVFHLAQAIHIPRLSEYVDGDTTNTRAFARAYIDASNGTLEPRFFKQYGSKRVIMKYGPYKVPASTEANGMKEFTDPSAEKPCSDCLILAMQAGLEYLNGTIANSNTGMWLHHGLLFDFGRADIVCPSMPYRFFASGNERTPVDVTLGGTSKTGVALYSNSTMGVVTELMNEMPVERDAVITIDFEYLPEIHNDFRSLDTLWLDVTGVCGDSDIDVPIGKPVFSYTAPDIMMKSSGKIIAAGGHLHDGGTLCRLTQNNKTLCDFEAFYGTSPGYVDPYGMAYHSNATNMSMAAEPMTHISRMPLCYNPGRYKVNDTFGIIAYYNATEHPLMLGEKSMLEAVMGISLLYVDNDHPSGPAQVEALSNATIGLSSSISVPSTTFSKGSATLAVSNTLSIPVSAVVTMSQSSGMTSGASPTPTNLGSLQTLFTLPVGAVLTIVTVYTSTVTTTSTSTSTSILSTVYVPPPTTTLTQSVTSTWTALVTSTNIQSVTLTQTAAVTSTKVSTVTSTRITSTTATQTATVTSTNISSITATRTSVVMSTITLSTTKTNTDVVTSTRVRSLTTSTTLTSTATAYVITSTHLTFTITSTYYTRHTTTSTLYAYFPSAGSSVSSMFTTAGPGISPIAILINAGGSYIPVTTLAPTFASTIAPTPTGWSPGFSQRGGALGELLQALGILPRPVKAVADIVVGNRKMADGEGKALETESHTAEPTTIGALRASEIGMKTVPLPLQGEQGLYQVPISTANSNSTPLPRSLAGHKISNGKQRELETKTVDAVLTQKAVVTKVEVVVVTISWAEKLVALAVETMVTQRMRV